MKKPKSITILTKEWFDGHNGNSYFAARITLNAGLSNQVALKVPLTYGYGDFYLQAAGELLQKLGYMKVEKVPGQPLLPLWRYCRENKITFYSSIEEGCLKKEVREWGE